MTLNPKICTYSVSLFDPVKLKISPRHDKTLTMTVDISLCIFPARAGWLLQRKTWEKELAEKWPVELSLLKAIRKHADVEVACQNIMQHIIIIFHNCLELVRHVFSKTSQDGDNSVQL